MSNNGSRPNNNIIQNSDTLALLKRVENLRKWQEEQQEKFLRDHQDQIKMIQLEQERIAKLVLQQPPQPPSQSHLIIPSSSSSSSSLFSMPKFNNPQDEDPELRVDDEDEQKRYNGNYQDGDDDEQDQCQHHRTDYEEEDYYENEEDENEFRDNVNDLMPMSGDENEYNKRLSTILEVSCEATPIKKQPPVQSVQQTRKTMSIEQDVTNKEVPLKTSQNIDDIPIGNSKQVNKTFEQLIEEKLREELMTSYKPSNKAKPRQASQATIKSKQQQVKPIEEGRQKADKKEDTYQEPQPQQQETNRPAIKGKRVFLKRGEGLKRFTGPPVKKTAKKAKSTSPPQQQSHSNKQPNRAISTKMPQTTNEKKQQQHQPAAPSSATNTKQQQQQSQTKMKEEKAMAVDRRDLYDNDEDGDQEDDDLNEFEVLEKYVEDHPSFRSSTSFVENLLTTGVKAGQRHQQQPPNIDEMNEEADDTLCDGGGAGRAGVGGSVDTQDHYYDDYMTRDRRGGGGGGGGFNKSSSPIQHGGGGVYDDQDVDVEDIDLYREMAKAANYEQERDAQREGTVHKTNQNGIQRKIKRLSGVTSNGRSVVKTTSTSASSSDCEEFDDYGHNNDKVIMMTSSHNDENVNRQLFSNKAYNASTYKSTSQIEFESSHRNNIHFDPSPHHHQHNDTTKFDDENTWIEDDGDGELNKNNILANINFTKPTNEVTQGGQSQVSSLMTKLFPSLKPKEQPIVQPPPPLAQQQHAKTMETTNTIAVNKLLNDKLRQLEIEIEKFRSKNDELTKLKEKQMAEYKQLEKQMEEFELYKEKEVSRLNELKECEVKKLNKEKKIFEQYQRSLKQGLSRQERDEIEKLKRQLQDLQVDFKQKEQRMSTNGSRLKDRCDLLEKENEQLKQELILLEKQRLETMVLLNNKAKIDTAITQQQQQQQQQGPGQVMSNSGVKAVMNQYRDSLQVQPSSQQYQQQQMPSPSYPTGLLEQTPQSIQSNHQTPMQQQPQPLLQRTTSDKSLGLVSNTVKYTPQMSRSPSISSTNSTAIQSPTNQQTSVPVKLTVMPQHPSQTQLAFNNSVKPYSPATLLNGSSHSNGSNSNSSSLPTTTTNNSQKQVKFKLDSNDNYNEMASNSNSSYRQKMDDFDSIPNGSGRLIQNGNGNDDSQCEDVYLNTLIDNRIHVKVIRQQKYDDGRVESYLNDGTIQTRFANGTLKETSSNKSITYVKFYNGDYKHIDHVNQIETYYYAQTNVTQIKYEKNECNGSGGGGNGVDGPTSDVVSVSGPLQIFKFPNGQIEKHYSDNTKEILFPDKTLKYIYPNGIEETHLLNGTIVKVNLQTGHKIIDYANKQREVHTQDYKRREYPDGSIKTVYSNGMSETRYANGRIRVKDEFGNIISDQKKTLPT